MLVAGLLLLSGVKAKPKCHENAHLGPARATAKRGTIQEPKLGKGKKLIHQRANHLSVVGSHQCSKADEQWCSRVGRESGEKRPTDAVRTGPRQQ